ncbi:MAG: itaconyl-CoA hydratase [Candidimonas sp.]|nr:MAG: itaconyl-CoA hydratase [Candidimonas sp.]
MTATPNPSDWIGHTESCADNMDAGHAERVALAVDRAAPEAGDALPPLWHWAFFVTAQPYARLGADGHPQRGEFLPPAENRNRMWAGGRVEFRRPLTIGTPARRVSTIAKVVEKTGRTGKLLFVTVRHDYTQAGAACIREEQDIVYREPSPPKLGGGEPAPASQWSETVTPSSVMLFRYSAVTFNGHRIHYDYPYAHDTEGYPNLVVHGPLIATLMIGAFTRAHPGKTIHKIAYRGLRPLIAPTPFQVAGTIESPGAALAWAAQGGTLAHRAEIGFGE